MPNKYASTSVAGDANQGAGYGTLKSPTASPEDHAEKQWPYDELRDRYPTDDKEHVDDEDESQSSVFKRSRRYEPGDRLQQANYHTGAFVNGSTRGLTGIMSGMDPLDALCEMIREAGFSGAFGQASKSYDSTGPFDARTRPGQRGGVGTTRGWSNSPVPKLTDPENEDHAWTLDDIARPDDVRSLRRNRLRLRDLRRKSVRGDPSGGASDVRKNEALRSYVRLCLDSPAL